MKVLTEEFDYQNLPPPKFENYYDSYEFKKMCLLINHQMECYATHSQLWRESKNLWFFIEPSFPLGAPLSLCYFFVPVLLRGCSLCWDHLSLCEFSLLVNLKRVWNYISLKFYKFCVFEEIPVMKNCGITWKKGKNATWGRQCTLFPTVMVSKWVPSSLETQSSMTVCFGAMADGELPISLMYFLTPSNVDRLGTDVKPKSKHTL